MQVRSLPGVSIRKLEPTQLRATASIPALETMHGPSPHHAHSLSSTVPIKTAKTLEVPALKAQDCFLLEHSFEARLGHYKYWRGSSCAPLLARLSSTCFCRKLSRQRVERAWCASGR